MWMEAYWYLIGVWTGTVLTLIIWFLLIQREKEKEKRLNKIEKIIKMDKPKKSNKRGRKKIGEKK